MRNQNSSCPHGRRDVRFQLEASAASQRKRTYLDGTLLPLDTNHEFGQYLTSIGWVDPTAWKAKNDAFLADHHRGALDLHKFIDFATAAWRDRPLADVLATRDAFVAASIVPFIPAAALALVRSHQDAGHGKACGASSLRGRRG